MAFILMLLLSLGTLVHVEVAVTDRNSDQMEVRRLAAFAAFKAMGQLQKEAGLDQRVTARADLLLAPGEAPVEGQGYWTGVWATDSGLSETQRQDVTWLVSGTDPDAYVATAEPVVLVSSAHSVLDDDQAVSVATESVDMGGSKKGLIAYWVTDENLKARVNLDDPYLGGADADSSAYDAQMAQVGDATAAHDSDGNQYFLPSDGNTSLWKGAGLNAIENMATLASLDFVASSADASRAHFHDFSLVSNSVLSNTKSGGLKRDLSTILLGIPTDLATANNGSIFGPAMSDSLVDPGGPMWEQLADYYQFALTEKVEPIDMRAPTNTQAGFAPVIARFNMIVQVFAQLPSTFVSTDPVTGDAIEPMATDYEYTIGYFPLITLWNPYDRDMTIPDLGLSADVRHVYIETADAAGVQKEVSIVRRYQTFNAEDGRGMLHMTVASTTIPAGQAINFTPPVNSFVVPMNGAEQNVLKPGASAELVRGFFIPFRTLKAAYTYSHGQDDDDPDATVLSSVALEDIVLRSRYPDKYVVQLYADNSFSSSLTTGDETRFISISAPGPSLNDLDFGGGMKAITPDKLGVTGLLSDQIEAEGASISEAYTDDSIFNLADFGDSTKTDQNYIYGVAIQLNLPHKDATTNYAHQSHFLSQLNVRTRLSSEQIQVFTQQTTGTRNYLYQLYTGGNLLYKKTGDPLEDFITGADDTYSPVGMANNWIQGSDQMVLFEVPETAPLGIGQFMHAPLQRAGSTGNSIDDFTFESNKQQANSTPSYAIGNSMANIHLPLGWTKYNLNQSDIADAFDGSYTRRANWESSQYDYSYLLNDALWDGYFLSTILPDNRPEVSFPLPNSRMERLPDALDTDLVDEQRAAANLLLKGGFNINSTSVAAWESVLGALRDVDTLREGPEDDELMHNYARFLSPVMQSAPADPDYGDRDAVAAGFRSLTDVQITELATQIVAENKRRCAYFGYPYGSLSDFINRSIATSVVASADAGIKRFAYMGPLQFAIDQSGINGTPGVDENWQSTRTSADGLWTLAGDGVSYVEDNDPGKEGVVAPYLADSVETVKNRPYAEGMPGFLTQADVLAKIGPVITARGDTFTIRAYGAVASELTGEATAEAYCEMVVQRIPEYVDSAADAAYADPTSATNTQLGRKFEIVSFRWLSADDI